VRAKANLKQASSTSGQNVDEVQISELKIENQKSKQSAKPNLKRKITIINENEEIRNIDAQ